MAISSPFALAKGDAVAAPVQHASALSVLRLPEMTKSLAAFKWSSTSVFPPVGLFNFFLRTILKNNKKHGTLKSFEHDPQNEHYFTNSSGAPGFSTATLEQLPPIALLMELAASQLSASSRGPCPQHDRNLLS